MRTEKALRRKQKDLQGCHSGRISQLSRRIGVVRSQGLMANRIHDEKYC